MPDVADLQEVVAAPAVVMMPISWVPIEQDLGTRLPSDYKRYIETYGDGLIDEFLSVFHPSTRYRSFLLEAQARAHLEDLRELRHERVPYPLYPDEGGILPWGRTENGDVCYWLSVGDPDTWRVVVNASRGPRWEEFDGGMVDFLVSVLRRDYVCRLFPRDFPSDEPVFEPRR